MSNYTVLLGALGIPNKSSTCRQSNTGRTLSLTNGWVRPVAAAESRPNLLNQPAIERECRNNFHVFVTILIPFRQRFRTARSDASVGTICRKIEIVFGLRGRSVTLRGLEKHTMASGYAASLGQPCYQLYLKTRFDTELRDKPFRRLCFLALSQSPIMVANTQRLC
jgi:hypothetical protein